MRPNQFLYQPFCYTGQVYCIWGNNKAGWWDVAVKSRGLQALFVCSKKRTESCDAVKLHASCYKWHAEWRTDASECGLGEF